MRKLSLIMVAILLALLVLPTFAQDTPNTGSAEIRFVHVGQDVASADIYVNQALRSFGRGVPYGTITGWVRVPAGELTVAVVPAGRSLGRAVVGPVTLNVEDGDRVIVYVHGAAFSTGIDATVTTVSDRILSANAARVTVFHGIQGLAPVDVYAGADTLLQGRIGYPGDIVLIGGGFNTGEATFDVLAGTYDLKITQNGLPDGVLIDLPDTTLEAGTHYLGVAAIVDGEPTVLIGIID